MAHQYLLDAIEKAASGQSEDLSALRDMIFSGRNSTSQHGLGWMINGGKRATGIFEDLSNGENIFHLLARKGLIADVLPAIQKSLLKESFIKRENLQKSLGLTGKSLTATENQINNFLKKYLNQPDASNKTLSSICNEKDKAAIREYLPQEVKIEASATAIRPIETDHDIAFKKLIQDLALYFREDNQRIKEIESTLGTDFNDLQLFIHLHNKFSIRFNSFITKLKNKAFLNVDDFFNKLFAVNATSAFVIKNSKAMDVFSLICYHQDTYLATKLLNLSTLSFLQKEYIEKALYYNSKEVLSSVIDHYGVKTDWQCIMFKSIEHGRYEVLEKYLSYIAPLTNNLITFSSKTGAKDYTAHTYTLHMLQAIYNSLAKKEIKDIDTTTEQIKLNNIFNCWDKIKQIVNLETHGSIIAKAIKKLPDDLKEKLAENDAKLLDDIMEYEPAISSGKSVASIAHSDRTDFTAKIEYGFLPRKGSIDSFDTQSDINYDITENLKSSSDEVDAIGQNIDIHDQG